MVPDDMGRLFAMLMTSPGFGHPFGLDVLIGTVYGVAIGPALSLCDPGPDSAALRSRVGAARAGCYASDAHGRPVA